MEKLAAPFTAGDIGWRIQRTGEYGGVLKGYAVPYIDSRAIASRLDEVFGVWGWQDSYILWHTLESKGGVVQSQLCGISVYDENRKDWVTKYDGAENSDIEPVKGGLSDSFKRAAVKWAIGRYLYQMEGVWVEVEKKGNSMIIKDSENTRLGKIYLTAVAKLFGAPAQKPEQPPKSGTAPKPESNQAEPKLYFIKAIAENNGASGTNTTLEIEDKSGKAVKAYLKGRHPELQRGTWLANVKITQKNGNYGPYNTMDSYELAA
jgi:hypothetical protein